MQNLRLEVLKEINKLEKKAWIAESEYELKELLKSIRMQIQDENLKHCKEWFKHFLNINATITYNGRCFLEIDSFSVEISNDEIKERAKQYVELGD